VSLLNCKVLVVATVFGDICFESGIASGPVKVTLHIKGVTNQTTGQSSLAYLLYCPSRSLQMEANRGCHAVAPVVGNGHSMSMASRFNETAPML
jgi:hypothetical protein